MTVYASLSLSLDGYYTGPTPSPLHPLGHGGEPLHDWFAHNGTSREHIQASDILSEEMQRLGAMVMGRDSYEHAQAEWGEHPPFEVPVFVVTHRAQADDVREGTTFHFVTKGFSDALDRAREAAGPRDIGMHGGGAIRQALRNGTLEQLQLHLVPILLRSGRHLFESLSYGNINFKQDRVVAGQGVTHLRYRVRYGYFSGTPGRFVDE